ncbi:DUF1214 domain-containing protein [Pseudomonas sp. 18173]|uniref:DUF1214 domain-containing protein n=1 Tax=Pseudomonas sp. 18173 TaxID=3390055 RepID=UPI003D1D089D
MIASGNNTNKRRLGLSTSLRPSRRYCGPDRTGAGIRCSGQRENALTLPALLYIRKRGGGIDIHCNKDGSVDIYFGPKALAGHESNWVPTKAGGEWFTMYRFYGPEKAVFDKHWKMTDIDQIR